MDNKDVALIGLSTMVIGLSFRVVKPKKGRAKDSGAQLIIDEIFKNIIEGSFKK